MTRLARAWGALESEQRLAAAAAFALVLTMLLPWYSKTVTVIVGNAARATQTSLSGIGAMSFVEAAVLLVSLGVLVLLFARAENRQFHMPGSDGMVVTIAGAWAALLIFYRLLDKPSLSGTQRITATVGLKWGIFFALAAACVLAYAGQRMRATNASEPPLVRSRGKRRAPVAEEVTVVTHAVRHSGRSTPMAPQAGQPSPSDFPVAPSGGTPVVEHGVQPSHEEHNRSPSPLGSPSRAPTSSTSAPRNPARQRPRYPPAPSEQLSFEDAPPEPDRD